MNPLEIAGADCWRDCAVVTQPVDKSSVATAMADNIRNLGIGGIPGVTQKHRERAIRRVSFRKSIGIPIANSRVQCTQNRLDLFNDHRYLGLFSELKQNFVPVNPSSRVILLG